MSSPANALVVQAGESVPEMQAFLVRSGLANAETPARWTPLTGGVSSDIWLVELPERKVCIKRALAKLKVQADWQAPVSRNAYEWEWMKFASKIEPHAVPTPLAQDLDAGLFAMQFLPPEQYPVWKSQLMDGHIDLQVAADVGRLLAHLHRASERDPVVEQTFATDENFHALRLEPYLLATAERHPKLAKRLRELVRTTATTHEALVHGDVSPKNILVGAGGPVILDAECAWYGDPAFDVAFLLNHLLLKCLVNPGRKADYLASFEQFVLAYFHSAPNEAVEQRAAALLPALMLARVDGKSPVEYITDDVPRDLLRRFASALIETPVQKLWHVAYRWNEHLQELQQTAFTR